MNSACVVRAHGAGLWSNINKVVTCLRIYDHVHVDWSKAHENDPAFKYGGSFYGDCWADLFEPTPRPEEPFDTIHDYPFYEITGGCAGVLYQNEQWGWRKRYHEAWQRLTCKISPMGLPDPYTVGVLIRSDALGGEQLYGLSQPLERYMNEIDKEIGDHHNVFIVCSDEESLMRMYDRYHKRMIYTDGIRRSKYRSDVEQHITIPQTKEDAIAVTQEVLTLATCRVLIHPVSNMSTAALFINPNLKSVYLK